MDVWFVRNFNFLKKEKRFVLREKIYYDANNDQVPTPALLTFVESFIKTSSTAQCAIVSADPKRMCLVFDIRNDGMVDLNSKDSFMALAYDNVENAMILAQLQEFFNFLFTSLNNIYFFTQMRFYSPFANRSFVKIAVAEFQCLFLVIDGRLRLTPLEFNIYPRKVTFHLVMHWSKLTLPIPISTSAHSFETEFLLCKHNLNKFRELRGIPEGMQCTEWLPDEKTPNDPLTLYSLYKKTFTAMYNAFGTEAEKLELFLFDTMMPETLTKASAAVQRHKIQAFANLQPMLLVYFANHFVSKYKFLFIWTQIWRLHHWIELDKLALS